MKKIMMVFAFFLAVAVSAQATEKKTFEGAIAVAGLTKKETKKVLAINAVKTEKIAVIRKQKLGKEEQKSKIKAIKKTSSAEIKAVVGKEKFKKMNGYWAKK